jgi:ribonuclease J
MGKHKIRIKSGDKVIFSSPDYIPGTTTSIYNLIDNLSRLGALVAYSEKEELHVSGHGYQKEHALLIRLLNPRYILPIGGNYRHIRSYQSLAKNAGIANDQLISPDYDSAITFYANGAVDTNFHLPLRQVLIDGLGVGDVGTTVLRDRKLLSQDGMFAIVLLIDSSSGQLFKPPSILSRGFVFVRESQELMEFLKTETVSTFNQATSRPPNLEYIRQQVQSRLEELILAKTGRQPMVLPLVIEV